MSESEVGYGKTPKHSRYKKGQSGNPSGRPRKKHSTFEQKLAAELESTVTVTERGRQKQVSKGDLILKQAINQAVGGNFKSLGFVMKILPGLERLNNIIMESKQEDRFDEEYLKTLSLQELSNLYRKAVAEWK
jgi:hypothetical protein